MNKENSNSEFVFQGREAEISRITAILGQRCSHHVILVGGVGVGKTALLHKLKSTHAFGQVKIVDVEKALLNQSTLLELLELKLQAGEAEQLIVALDGLDALLTADRHACELILGWIKRVLIENSSRLILVCNKTSYHQFFASDERLINRCQVVALESPNFMTAVAMVSAHRDEISSHHNIAVPGDVVSSAVALSHRYIHDAVLPGSAILLLDSGASSLKQKQLSRPLELEDLIDVVSQLTGISKTALLISDEEKLRHCADRLAQVVCGQGPSLAVIQRTLQAGFLKLHSTQPMAMMVFVGEKGTGKMLAAKAIANLFYGSESYLLRFNMSEYQEADGLKRLLGDGVTHGLLKKIRTFPCAVYLFERIELAHSQVISELSDLLMRGAIDGQDLSYAIVIMTTEMGLEAPSDKMSDHAKLQKNELIQLVLDELPGMRAPEEQKLSMPVDNRQEETQTFINQFGESFYRSMTVVPFNRLQLTGLEQCIELELKELRQKLEAKHNIHLSYSPNLARELLTYLSPDNCSVAEIKRLFDEKILAIISRTILNSNVALHALSLLLEQSGEIQCRGN